MEFLERTQIMSMPAGSSENFPQAILDILGTNPSQARLQSHIAPKVTSRQVGTSSLCLGESHDSCPDSEVARDSHAHSADRAEPQAGKPVSHSAQQLIPRSRQHHAHSPEDINARIRYT
jgi:hypothetical protein